MPWIFFPKNIFLLLFSTLELYKQIDNIIIITYQ